jgi:hypothetical protein
MWPIGTVSGIRHVIARRDYRLGRGKQWRVEQIDTRQREGVKVVSFHGVSWVKARIMQQRKSGLIRFRDCWHGIRLVIKQKASLYSGPPPEPDPGPLFHGTTTEPSEGGRKSPTYIIRVVWPASLWSLAYYPHRTLGSLHARYRSAVGFVCGWLRRERARLESHGTQISSVSGLSGPKGKRTTDGPCPD